MFRKLRILILLFVLATVALEAWRANTRVTTWEQTVLVGIYPIAADDSPTTARFVADLDGRQFEEVAVWAQAQSRDYGKAVLRPVSMTLATPLTDRPPSPHGTPGAIDAMLWSLKLRWWASRHDAITGPKPDVRLFVLFHDPDRTALLPHSTGLAKGRIGVIHAFSSSAQQRQNAVVIAHELLHTFGASDKYDFATLQPLFPHGYAEPQRNPRLPQRFAEIMGGRTPIDDTHAEIPASLSDTVIGEQTATEIGLRPPTH